MFKTKDQEIANLKEVLAEEREKSRKAERSLKLKEEDIEDLNRRHKRELVEKDETIAKLKDTEKRLNEEFKKKEEHAVALMKAKTQEEIFEKVNETKAAAQEEIQKIKDEYAEKEKKLVEENFNKLSDSMQNLHEKGNANTRYIEKASMKMMDVLTQVATGKPVQNLPQLTEPEAEEEPEYEEPEYEVEDDGEDEDSEHDS